MGTRIFLSNVSASGGGGIGGTNYIYVMANGSPTENATELTNAYATAQTMSPSPSNRITIVAAPGYYDFGFTTFNMSVPCIDLVSLDGNRSILFSSSSGLGTLWVTGNNIFVCGVDVTINNSKSLCVGDNLFATIIKNCKGGICSFGFGGDISGTFIDCEAGFSSFAAMAFSGAPAGVLNNNTPPVASGRFINCVANGGQSFGFSTMFPAAATGQFVNCDGSNGFSFGVSFSAGAVASGSFTDCKSGMISFGSNFSGTSVASGTFIRCGGTGDTMFGGGSGTASGTFRFCRGGAFSYAASGGTVSGTFYFCEMNGASQWFTVSGGGKVIYCTDDINGVNNQGFVAQNNV